MEVLFSKVFRALPMAAMLSRISDRRFIDVNDAWERLTGYRREEQLGRTSLELGLWADPSQRVELFRQLSERPFVRDFEATLRQASGALRELLLSVDCVEMGGEPCLLLLAHDLTDHRRLQRELRQSQKMEAIGRLAGGIAHEFNNLLTAIGGASGLLLSELPAGDPRLHYCETIQRATRRATSLTRQLLTFSRKQPMTPKILDPNEVARGTVEMLRPMVGADIDLRCRLDAGGRVKGDRGLLEQVIVNLMLNARDAMPHGGTLTVSTADAGEWVKLSVADTGTGMTAETRAHLFEPFFTTKEPGKGTGLGLSTVYGIVTEAGGHVLVDSTPGQGSVFAVHLPLRAHEAPQREELPAAGPVPGGRETVLLVEDDDSVREFASLVLSRLGYRVLDAADGPAALKISSELHGPIDLVVCDVVMPQMNGLEVVRRLRQTRPGIKAMHISGYPGDTVPPEGPGGSVRLLNKPFDQAELARSVRSVLDAQA